MLTWNVPLQLIINSSIQLYMEEIIASRVQGYLFCELYMAIKENPQMTRSILFINTVIVEINLPLT